MKIFKEIVASDCWVVRVGIIFGIVTFLIGGCDDSCKKYESQTNEGLETDLTTLMDWRIDDFEERFGDADKCYETMEQGKTCYYQELEPYFLVYRKCGIAIPVEDYRYIIKFVQDTPVSLVIRELDMPLSRETLSVFGLGVREPDSWSYSSYSGNIGLTWENIEGFDFISFQSCGNKSVLERVRFVRHREHAVSVLPHIYEHVDCDELAGGDEGRVRALSVGSVEKFRGCRNIIVD